MIPEDEKHVTIHTDIEDSPQFYGWLCGLDKGVRILLEAGLQQAIWFGGCIVEKIPSSQEVENPINRNRHPSLMGACFLP